MSDNYVVYVIAPIVSAVLGGLAWLVRRYFEKKDEEQKAIFEERDKDKQEMKDNIASLQGEVKKTNKRVNELAGMIMACEHPDCPTRKRLGEFLQNSEA